MSCAFGKTLEKVRRNSFLELVSILEMVDTRVFGEIGISKLKDVFFMLFRLAAHKFASMADL